MRRLLLMLLVSTALCRGELVRERWGGADTPCTHPGTLQVVQGEAGTRLVFDLSAIPRGARLLHASLTCFTEDDAQPTEPPRVLAASKPGGALELERPRYRSFDATEAVRRAVKKPERELRLSVERFERFLAPRTHLEVLYEGKATTPPEQAAGLRVVHHDGQTFIAWREVAAFRPEADEVVWVAKFSELGDRLADGPG
ncbi:MAG: hypothetical protein ACODAJ_17035, partial [Planctomycetota bacterium]